MSDTGTEKDEFIGQARKRFEVAAEEERHLREKFVSDLKFASPDGDEQWDPKVKQDREANKRPAMSFPRCHTFVQQVSNEARQNKPQVKFAPRLDADKDTAEIYEGLARYIQYTSDAQVAYETAIEYSAGGSFGFYRFLTNYVDEDSEDLELGIVPVLDPLTIYGVLVPACFNRPVPYAFVIEEIRKEEFKRLYPDTEMATLDWAEVGSQAGDWVTEETVRIAEYWYVEESTEKPEAGKRKAKPTVKFCKINGIEVLPGSETVWAGSTIPIIPVLGKQMIMEGKPHLFSIVRPQKAAQQLINYSKSRIAETLSTSPISPFMVAAGQIEGYEAEWETLNTVNRPFLTYKVVDTSGRPIPPPTRQTFEPPIQSLSAFVAQEVDDMKATTGIFDASLGNNGNETSGQAIQKRQQQANLSTMHFMDNLERSFKRAGKVIEELIPKIYDTPREVTILGQDEAPKIVKINQGARDQAGKAYNYDIANAKVSLVITIGKAYGSKRAESFDTISQVVQTSPNMFPMVGDILFRNSDMAGADQLAERLHKLLPPNLQDDQENPLPPQAQAAVAQAQQQMQEMHVQLQQLAMEKQGKVWETQGKLQQISAQSQADMALENRKLENALTIAEVDTKAQSILEREKLVGDMEKQFHVQAHEFASQKDDHAHEHAMGVVKAKQAQNSQTQQAQLNSQQSAQDAQQQEHSQAKQKFAHTAVNEMGHRIGSNDGKTWFDANTGATVQ